MSGDISVIKIAGGVKVVVLGGSAVALAQQCAQRAEDAANDADGAVASSIRVDQVQAFSGAQKHQAQDNIGLRPDNDATMAANDADRVPSQQAVVAFVMQAISDLVNGSPVALNTLKELADSLGDDANFSVTITTALGNRLRFDVNNQGLTGPQQTNARTNLGIPNVENKSSAQIRADLVAQNIIDALAFTPFNVAKLDDDVTLGAAAADRAPSQHAVAAFVPTRVNAMHVDLEIPTGAVDGLNMTFDLGAAPSPATSCIGYIRQGGAGAFLPLLYGYDFALAGHTVTLNAPPDLGSDIRFSYRK